MPRFDNQLQHLAALSLHLVDLVRDELLEFVDIGRELANTFRGFLRRHCIFVHEVAEFLLIQLEHAITGERWCTALRSPPGPGSLFQKRILRWDAAVLRS